MPVVDRSRRAGTARSGPYDLPAQHRSAAAAQARSQQLHDEPEAGEFIKVSADSKPKAVAGKIAHTAREGGDPPAVLTIGAPCINQAVKAIAIARQYLDEDGLDLNFQPAFRHADRCAAVPRLCMLWIAGCALCRLWRASNVASCSGAWRGLLPSTCGQRELSSARLQLMATNQGSRLHSQIGPMTSRRRRILWQFRSFLHVTPLSNSLTGTSFINKRFRHRLYAGRAPG